MSESLNPQVALLYGKFIQAAYTMFRSNPTDPLPEPQGIPDDYELGAWIQMSDFFLDAEKPEFYGIVAHKKADPQTRVIAIRGTEGKIEWLDDMDAVPVPFHQVPSAGRVAQGFDRIYKTLKVVKRHIPGSLEPPPPAAPRRSLGLSPTSSSNWRSAVRRNLKRKKRRAVLVPGVQRLLPGIA